MHRMKTPMMIRHDTKMPLVSLANQRHFAVQKLFVVVNDHWESNASG